MRSTPCLWPGGDITMAIIIGIGGGIMTSIEPKYNCR
jgi:hypothetical protein